MLVTLCGFFPKHLASAHFLNWLSCELRSTRRRTNSPTPTRRRQLADANSPTYKIE